MIRITSPPVTHTDASIKARRTVVLVADLQQGSNEMIGSDKGKPRPRWIDRGFPTKGVIAGSDHRN